MTAPSSTIIGRDQRGARRAAGWIVGALALAACGGGAARGGRTTPLRPGCAVGEYWDGTACLARGGAEELDQADLAIAEMQLDVASAALERAAARPLDHESYVRLWQEHGRLRAAAGERDEAKAAFARLLEAEPGHAINCLLGAPIFTPFQEARAAAAGRAAPQLELRWRRDLRLGEPVPIDVETIADPSAALRGLTLYVRARGEEAWRAADVKVPAPGTIDRVVLPPFAGTRPTALELFAVASDERGNEIHQWASREHPRELTLRYDPPTPWYRKWWVWAAAGGVVAVGTGVGVYAAVWAPSAEIDASVTGTR